MRVTVVRRPKVSVVVARRPKVSVALPGGQSRQTAFLSPTLWVTIPKGA